MVAPGDCHKYCPQAPRVAGAGGGEWEEACHMVTPEMRLELRAWHGPPCLCSLLLPTSWQLPSLPAFPVLVTAVPRVRKTWFRDQALAEWGVILHFVPLTRMVRQVRCFHRARVGAIIPECGLAAHLPAPHLPPAPRCLLAASPQLGHGKPVCTPGRGCRDATWLQARCHFGGGNTYPP